MPAPCPCRRGMARYRRMTTTHVSQLARSLQLRERNMNQGCVTGAVHGSQSPLHHRQGAGEYTVRVESLRAGMRQIPHARHLAPAVVVARAHDQEIVPRREREYFAAARRWETQCLGSTIHDLESIDPRDDECAEAVAVILPVFRERSDADGALALDRREDPHHALRTSAETVARQRLDRTDRDDVLAVHAPLDAGQ